MKKITKGAIGIGLAIVVLSATLLMDIDSFLKIFVASVLAGLVTGVFMFWRQASGGDGSSIEQAAGIRIHSITIQGGIGTGIIIAVLLGAALVEVPMLRWIALPGVFAGLVAGGSIAIWRHHNE